jgi:uncharacterized protein YjbI with pentapeptide repeats
VANGWTDTMKIKNENHRMEVHKADLSRSKFDDLNMSGWRVHSANLSGLQVEKANLAGASFVDARLEGATIEGVSVTDLLAYWRAGHGARSA